MSWYRWKFWRIADARNPWGVYDAFGYTEGYEWRHIGFGFYWRMRNG